MVISVLFKTKKVFVCIWVGGQQVNQVMQTTHINCGQLEQNNKKTRVLVFH